MPFIDGLRVLNFISFDKELRIGGVGGTASAFLGRVKSITLGRYVIEEPVARFSLATKGDYASAKYDGLMGGEIFRRFKMAVDLSRRRIILEPNQALAEAFEVDMSGIELVADGEDFSIFLVDEVEKSSPAGEAGVRGGDRLVTIEERPVSEFTLAQIRRMFMQDGKSYLLGLRREDQLLKVRLKLRRAI